MKKTLAAIAVVTLLATMPTAQAHNTTEADNVFMEINKGILSVHINLSKKQDRIWKLLHELQENQKFRCNTSIPMETIIRRIATKILKEKDGKISQRQLTGWLVKRPFATCTFS